jgi:hypothetical protein
MTVRLIPDEFERFISSTSRPPIPNGEIIFGGGPTAADPAGTLGYFVRCTKHASKWFRIMVDLSQHFDLRGAAIEALKQCPDCANELANSLAKGPRFPEGSEL